MHPHEGTDEAAVKLFFLLFFFIQFMSEENKGAAARWVDALAALLLWKNKTRGGERGIWEGDSLQSARMVYVPIAEISAEALP